MADDRIQMPSSGGGIIRYFDDYKSKIEIPPKVVVGIIVVITVLALLAHYLL